MNDHFISYTAFHNLVLQCRCFLLLSIKIQLRQIYQRRLSMVCRAILKSITNSLVCSVKLLFGSSDDNLIMYRISFRVVQRLLNLSSKQFPEIAEIFQTQKIALVYNFLTNNQRKTKSQHSLPILESLHTNAVVQPGSNFEQFYPLYP